MMTNDPEVHEQYTEAMISSKTYPEGYNGPKAGISDDKEWLAVRDFQAYKWACDGTWRYSDFDCWVQSQLREMRRVAG
jgi:hypothetical protein